jgi:hypothetical protein
LLLYLAIASASNINIGIRHLAPVYPFLFLLGGTFLDNLMRRTFKPGVIVAVLLLSWMVFVAVRAYPNYMSFISPLSGNKPGWRLLSDSNVEWGEDVGAMANYLKQRGETKVSGMVAGGWMTPELYGVEFVGFVPPELELAQTRYVAIGASHLNGSTNPNWLRDKNGHELTDEKRRNYFASYRSEMAEAVFGGSIFLFRRKK